VKTGVLVMAYGTPTTPDDVLAYYTRIRHGHPPTNAQLDDLVFRYNAIGGISPLAQRTADQVSALARVLEEQCPGQFDVRFGSKYEPPLLEASAQSFRDEGFTTVIALALAPHSSAMSTGQYMSRAREALGPDINFVGVQDWWEAPGFLELIASRVHEVLDEVPGERHRTTEVIFSAHSLPEKILESGDTYPDQLRESARRAASLAGVTRYDTCWQSAGRTLDTWLGPDILQVLPLKKEEGVTDLISCPIGFVSDHLEVLYDIDIAAQDVAHEIGLHLTRTRSLNDDPEFIAVLANVVRAAHQ
jgi:protoporphyrin/coproporphyrin ferrochelatase